MLSSTQHSPNQGYSWRHEAADNAHLVPDTAYFDQKGVLLYGKSLLRVASDTAHIGVSGGNSMHRRLSSVPKLMVGASIIAAGVLPPASVSAQTESTTSATSTGWAPISPSLRAALGVSPDDSIQCTTGLALYDYSTAQWYDPAYSFSPAGEPLIAQSTTEDAATGMCYDLTTGLYLLLDTNTDDSYYPWEAGSGNWYVGLSGSADDAYFTLSCVGSSEPNAFYASWSTPWSSTWMGTSHAEFGSPAGYVAALYEASSNRNSYIFQLGGYQACESGHADPP